MTRSELSRLADIPGRTIRYYEERGIIPPPKRRANGYREYDKTIITLLNFIKNAQKLGFSLHEIMELSEMKISPGASCETIHTKASEKIQDIEKRIAELLRIKDALIRFTGFCQPGKSAEECEFIHLLEQV